MLPERGGRLVHWKAPHWKGNARSRLVRVVAILLPSWGVEGEKKTTEESEKGPQKKSRKEIGRLRKKEIPQFNDQRLERAQKRTVAGEDTKGREQGRNHQRQRKPQAGKKINLRGPGLAVVLNVDKKGRNQGSRTNVVKKGRRLGRSAQNPSTTKFFSAGRQLRKRQIRVQPLDL